MNSEEQGEGVRPFQQEVNTTPQYPIVRKPGIGVWGVPARVAARLKVSRPGAGARCMQIYPPDSS